MSHWRVAAEEINYRRFFDIDELAAIRVEDADVFTAVHARIIEGIHEGWITGLRIDHPDGLYDPARYFSDLQRAIHAPHPARAGVNEDAREPFFVVAEKIMAAGESPRADWVIQGTTGYDFLNEVNGLFVDPAAKNALHKSFADFTGRAAAFPDLVYESKRLVLQTSMSSELNVLSRRLDRIFQQHRHSRDFTLNSSLFALREIIACFPVYRTYAQENAATVSEEDRNHITAAVAEAERRNPAMDESIFRAIASILLLDNPAGLPVEQESERRLFVMRFQQLTGPVMAKGLEDTAFYRQYPLASLNEVGGNPELFGLDPETFHANVSARARHWPGTFLTTSTHDTKRSEDLRARLNVLSEIPDEWAQALHLWASINEPFKTQTANETFPDRAAEHLLYQTLAGIWPAAGCTSPEQHGDLVHRMLQYMEKAAHEAKLNTSWINPNPVYDTSVREFTAAVLRLQPDNRFLPAMERFSRSISMAGYWNSLSQTILKLAGPGVPDIYQGNELWNFALVDPDNRRPVDYDRCRELLSSLAAHQPGSLDSWLGEDGGLSDGRLKLFVTASIARLRRDNPDFFRSAEYIPLQPAGKWRDHVIGFALHLDGRTVIAACGRFFVKLGCRFKPPAGEEVWQDTRIDLPAPLSGAVFRDVFSGALVDTGRNSSSPGISIGDAFSKGPFAVLDNGKTRR